MKLKSVFKRFLFLGISLIAVVLVATQNWETSNADLDPAGDDPDSGSKTEKGSGSPPKDSKPVRAPMNSITFRPLAGITVTFSGTVIRAGSRFALRETGGILYTLDSVVRAWPFEGEAVRVTGKLDTGKRLLCIDEIRSMTV